MARPVLGETPDETEDRPLQDQCRRQLADTNPAILGRGRVLVIDQTPQGSKIFLPSIPAARPLRIPTGLKMRLIGSRGC